MFPDSPQLKGGCKKDAINYKTQDLSIFVCIKYISVTLHVYFLNFNVEHSSPNHEKYLPIFRIVWIDGATGVWLFVVFLWFL